MATKLAKVTVTRTAGNQFQVSCTCGHATPYNTRPAADLMAVEHRRDHVTANPADQEA